MTSTNRRAVLLATSMLVLPLLTGPARAQRSEGIPEIIVTAQRKAENVLAVPLSIQAISGEAITKTGMRDLTDLQYTAPGFIANESSAHFLLFVRGIGNSIFVGTDPSVATYIDDVPRMYATLIPNFIDVERLEVLKGAQGGLYGRNATGGVLNIVTRSPNTDQFEGRLKVQYGERNTLAVAGYVNVPLNDKIAFNVAAQRERHDPYIRNINHANPFTAANFPSGSYLGTPQQTANFFNSGVHPLSGYGNQNVWAVKGKILVKPSDNFKVTLALDYTDKADTNGSQFYTITPAYTAAAAAGFFGNFGINAVFPPGFTTTTAGKFTGTKSTTSDEDNRDGGASLTAVYNAPGVDLTSITAYRFQRSNFYDAFPPLNFPLVEVSNVRHRSFFYQELRGVSTFEGRWHLIGGATYMRNKLPLRQITALLPPLFYLPVSVQESIVKNWSVYLQVGYDITDELSLTVSGRYIHENYNSDFILPQAETSKTTNKKFVPSATLSYKLPGGGNIYARYAKGYKGGGINPVALTSAFANPNLGAIFGPETLDTYEAGYRAPLLDNTLQITTAIFYNDYKNLQIQAANTPAHPEITFAIVNGGTARTYGAEASITWRPIEALTLGVNGGYLNAKYKKTGIPVNAYLQSFNLDGQQMLNAPKFQLNLSADLDQPINDNYRLVANVLVAHVSRVIYSQSAVPGVLADVDQPGYWLTNLRLGLRTSDDKYGVAVFAQNAFNKLYAVSGSSLNLGNLINPGKPRVIGGEITAKF